MFNLIISFQCMPLIYLIMRHFFSSTYISFFIQFLYLRHNNSLSVEVVEPIWLLFLFSVVVVGWIIFEKKWKIQSFRLVAYVKYNHVKVYLKHTFIDIWFCHTNNQNVFYTIIPLLLNSFNKDMTENFDIYTYFWA